MCWLVTKFESLLFNIYPDKVEAFEMVLVPPGKAPGIPVTIVQLLFSFNVYQLSFNAQGQGRVQKASHRKIPLVEGTPPPIVGKSVFASRNRFFEDQLS